MSLAQRLLAKPAAGALVIVVFVWVVFAVLSTARGNSAFLSIPGTLGYLDVAAQVGIIGTAVALLMIAGEFDLSVGSMVGFAGIMIGICVTIWGLPIWLSIIIAVALTTGLGAINGIIVVRTGLPSFIVTLATLFIIAGLSSVLTSLVTNITYIPISPTLIAADPLAAIFTWKLSFKIGDQTTDFQASIVWWIIIATVGAYILGSTPVRQLDRRRRRLAERGAQPRRPGGAGEDHAVRHDGLLGRDPGRPSRACASRRPTSCAAAASS